MRLTFLGTRGEIEARSKRHRMHSSVLVTDSIGRIMIDCAIEDALSKSQYLVLLACPEAAASGWVSAEVEYWVKHRTPDKLLIVHTGGTLEWAADFNWDSCDALPEKGAPAEMGHRGPV
jgi:hypothetical protein